MRSIGADQRSRSGARRLKTFVLCALAILAIALLVPRGAEADYTVLECAPGEQVGFSDVALYAGGGYSILPSNDCGGYGFRLDAKGVSASGSWLAWQVNAPGGTRFKSAQATVHYGTDGGYGPMSTSDGSPGYQGLAGGTGPDVWNTPVQTNASFFAVIEKCFANPCNSGWAYAWSTRFFAVVQDFYAPGVSASGELLDGSMVRGVQPLQVTATDAGGGARSISISVNGVASQGIDFCAPPRARAAT